MMTYKEFLALIKTVTTPATLINYREACDPCIYVSWITGGVTGGSCWDSDDSRLEPVRGEPEPEFEMLDKVLEKVCPDIGFLAYKNLCAEVVETLERHENEYYGNYTDTCIKKVDLKKLYDALVERGLLGNT